jgi:hypothetical protein
LRSEPCQLLRIQAFWINFGSSNFGCVSRRACKTLFNDKYTGCTIDGLE